MRYLSLFSGMECAWQAWHPLGWECVGVAEIDPRACELLAYRLPNVPNLGSVTDITAERIAALGPLDVVIGGSPCQDLSVAGKRAGLGGARSGLFHEQLRIFDAARHFCGARWLVWENVPGAFSSHEGRDFAVVVGAMAGLELAVPRDGWGNEGVAVGENGLVEWSVLDAQWFGVAQRRRRVFAVLDTGNWADRSPVLLERDRLRGDSAPRREAGERPAPTISARTSGGGGLGTDFDLDCGLNRAWPADVACTLNAAFGSKQGLEDQHALGGGNCLSLQSPSASKPRPDNATTQRIKVSLPPVSMCLNAGAMGRQDAESETLIPTFGGGFDVAHTLRAEGFDAIEDGSGRGTPLVPVAFDTYNQAVTGDVSMTLCSRGDSPGGNAHLVPAIAFSCKDHGADAGEISPTLRSMGHDGSHANAGGQVAVALPIAFSGQMSNPQCDVDLTQTLGAKNPMAMAMAMAMAVRRLTPCECERLQGVEDDWTLVPSGKKGKPMADGPRYKMLGNSFARPVITWIGQQIERATLESRVG